LERKIPTIEKNAFDRLEKTILPSLQTLELGEMGE